MYRLTFALYYVSIRLAVALISWWRGVHIRFYYNSGGHEHVAIILYFLT
jgi:hypothetical protein